MVARHASRLEALFVDDVFEGDIYPNEPMARHTTYRIGGPARFFVRVNSIGALMQTVEACDDVSAPWIVVGRGANLLVSDEGFDGVIITLGRDFRVCRYHEEQQCFAVGAGVALSSVVQEAFRRSLSGLEFAVGTPGSIGGAIRMNAGSRDVWIGSCVSSVTCFSLSNGLELLHGSSIEWGYRTSSLSPDKVIIECELEAQPADPFLIRNKMEAALAKRRKSQPLSKLSCGSVFKNPPGDSAGRLIEAAGLKGYTCGGAKVSEQHANFILNEGGATAADVVAVMQAVQKKVYQDYGIELAPEVRFIGFK